jgi:hypothetical protein
MTRKAAFAPVFIACLNLLALSLWFLQARAIASKAEPVAIRHFLPRDSGSDDIFSAQAVLRRLTAKTQIRFILNGQSADAATLNTIQTSALSLKKQSDTNRIVKVTMTDQVSYQEVIALINLAMRNDIKRYMLWKNEFYLLPADGDVKSITPCPCVKKTAPAVSRPLAS